VHIYIYIYLIQKRGQAEIDDCVEIDKGPRVNFPIVHYFWLRVLAQAFADVVAHSSIMPEIVVSMRPSLRYGVDRNVWAEHVTNGSAIPLALWMYAEFPPPVTAATIDGSFIFWRNRQTDRLQWERPENTFYYVNVEVIAEWPLWHTLGA
jgi:hypothetical protein